MVGWSLCAVAIGFGVPVDAIEPVAIEPASWLCGLQWLGWLIELILSGLKLIAFAIPGLPERLVDVVTKRPVMAVILLGGYLLIRRTSSWAKAAEAEYAFQACPDVSILEPSACVRHVGKIVPPVWLTWGVVIGFGLLIFLDLFCRPAYATDTPCTANTVAETAIGSANTYNLRRLAPGEKVQVTMRSDRARNETGVWLEKDVTYTARYRESHDWRDRNRPVEPCGFRFENNCIGLPRFWWMKRMRPHPNGAWFQVIGRIDHGHEVFAILDGKDAGKPYEVRRPVSGELVLLVNDVIYGNNHGLMTIEICHCRADE